MHNILPQLHRQRGQAILVVLLTMAVILTVVLSVISRTVTDISLTTYSEDALRAFSAAEAGVERALIVGTNVSETVGEATFSANVSGLAEGSSSFNYPVEIYSGESLYIWFVSHDATSDLVCASPTLPCFTGSSAQVCWGKPGTPSDANSPAVEVSVFYDPSGTGVAGANFSGVRVARATFDPYVVGRSPANNFTSALGSCSVGTATYPFSADINLAGMGIPCLGTQGCLLTARVRTLYNSALAHPVGINVVGGVLPAQGRFIESTGTTTSQSSVRKIEAYRTFGGPAPIFDAAVFSQGSVTKP